MHGYSSGLRKVAVCVDDFGLHRGVNRAVLKLLSMHRISAVSCLVDGPAWVSGAQALRQAVGHPDRAIADVGLHLNFTETLDVAAQAACPSRPLGELIKACYLRQLQVPALVREIDRQWDRFEAIWGRAPDFIDGHQHVHQLPQIRTALQQVLQKRCRAGAVNLPWLRQCRSPGLAALLAGINVSDTIKALVIAALGARALGQSARAMGLRHSQRLLGVYPFDADAARYKRRWQAWLKLARPRGDLIMCHPAAPMSNPPPWPDVIAPSRLMEYKVLTSAGFGRQLEQAGVQVARLGR